MRIEDIEIDHIDVPAGRRVLDPNWVEALSEEFKTIGHRDPIQVVAIGERYRLTFGGHRLAAKKRMGATTIAADVKQAGEFASEASMKLSEIAENFMRRELTVLDRSFDVAAWREIFEAATGAIKPGKKAISRKLATNSTEELQALSEQFSGSFSEAARTALRLSRDAIFRALKISTIEQAVRERISLHGIADNQSELLALAAQTASRQASIAGLLTSSPPAAASVADAIAILDRAPVAAKAEPWARLSDKFSKLPEPAQRKFFQEHWDLIEVMIAEGAAR